MAGEFRFNRAVVHWCPPQRLDLAEHVRRGRLQLVQCGNFGPMFYGLADDPEVARWFPGQPLVGIDANLEYAADLIRRVREAGARYVGQMSISWHYGDAGEGKGLFGAWQRIWTDGLLGPAPAVGAEGAQQRLADGSLRHWPIEGRPYETYSGCMCNPLWLEILKPMVRKAVELGVQGFNVHHNFEGFCQCGYCREYVWARLAGEFGEDELAALYGSADLEAVTDVLSPGDGAGEDLTRRVRIALERAAHHRRKEAFDEVFVRYGRSLDPDLLLAQWYHKYNFKPRDERSLLPPGLWARDEDYIWYSQGSAKGTSSLRHGYLADMGLPARFVQAAAGGRPFFINKYDWTRWRLAIAEAGAHGFAGLAVHWSADGEEESDPDRYADTVFPYHAFLADRHYLYQGVEPHAQVALVYPRRSEVAGQGDPTDALRRIGRILEDRHILFDIILDGQLVQRGVGYECLVLADVPRLADGELEFLKAYVQRGGCLALTRGTGVLDSSGAARHEPFAAWDSRWPATGVGEAFAEGEGRVLLLGENSWAPESVEIRPGTEVPTYPPGDADALGDRVAGALAQLLAPPWLATEAPWFVRVRAWRTRGALVLHWVNYQRDEEAEVEEPLAVGPFGVEVRLPDGWAGASAAWHTPEKGIAPLPVTPVPGGRVAFSAPRFDVYGIAVLSPSLVE